MTEILLKIPAQIGSGQIEDLKAELKLHAEVTEPATRSFDLASVVLIVGAIADTVAIADTLTKWIKHTPRGNQVEIRLSDGRTLKMESNADPDEFIKQLKTALKNLQEG